MESSEIKDLRSWIRTIKGSDTCTITLDEATIFVKKPLNLTYHDKSLSFTGFEIVEKSFDLHDPNSLKALKKFIEQR